MNSNEIITTLADTEVRSRITKQIKDEIDSFTAWKYDDGFRWHLGASKIGDDCKRKLWYGFRWAFRRTNDGRIARLYNRGHREEARHVEWLRGIGFTVWTHDEGVTKPDGTHPQLRIRNKCGGHLGGSLDGIVQFPDRYRVSGYAVLESKTSGTGKGFNDLDKLGMGKSKPQHYIQNSIYGYDYGIEDALYICANKNDDSLYVEVVKLDFNLAKQMEIKAESIITAQQPPARLSENSNHFQCKNLCEFKEICFEGREAMRNCRSCIKCKAVEGGEFYCESNQGVIPRNFIPQGCNDYQSIVVQSDSRPLIPIKKATTDHSNEGMFTIETGIEIPK